MPDSTKSVDILLGWKVDKNSQQQVVASTRQIKDELAGIAPITKAGVTSVRTQFDLLKSGQKDLARDLGDLKRDYAALGDNGAAALKELQISARQAASANDTFVDSLREEMRVVEQTAESHERLNRERSNTGKTGGGKNLFSANISPVGSSLSAIGGLNTLGAAGAPLREAGQLADSVEYLSRTPEAVKNLATSLGTTSAGLIGSLGVAAVAAGAVVVVLNEYNKALDVQRDKLKGALSAQDTFYADLGRLTTEQAKEEVAKRQRANELLQQQIDETQGAISQSFQTAQQEFSKTISDNPAFFTTASLFSEQAGDFVARAATALGQLPTAQLEGKLGELRTEFTDNEQVIGRYTRALEANAFVVNDLAELEIAVMKARADASALLNAPETLSGEIDRQIDLQQRRNRLTIDNADTELASLQERQQQLKIERDILQGYKPLLEADLASKDPAKIEQAAQQLERLLVDIPAELAGLNNVLLPYATQVDTLANIFESGKDIALAYADAAGKANDATDKFNDSLAKLGSARDTRIGELADKLQNDLADLGEDLSDQQAKQSAGDLDELKKFHEAEAKRVEEHRLRLRDIERQYDNSSKNAIQDRDAVALDQAQRTREEAVAGENEKFTLESAQRQQDLENLKQSQAAEQRELVANYQKRYSRLIEQNQREVSAAIAKYNADVQLQRQAHNQQLADLKAALDAETQLKNAANLAMLNSAKFLVNSVLPIVGQLTGMSPGVANLASAGANIVSNLLGFDGGGMANANQFVRLNERGIESGVNSQGDFAVFSRPTRVFTAQQTQQMLGGGVTVNIPIAGTQLTRRQITQHVVGTLNAKLQEAGWQ